MSSVHIIGFLLWLGTALVSSLDCPTSEIREKLELRVVKHASSKFTSIFSEYYVTSPMVPYSQCAYMESKKDPKRDDHYELAMVVKDNSGNIKRAHLTMSENKNGVLELKEKGLLISKIYPIFVTENVIGYVMCVSMKELKLAGDFAVWASVAVRNDKISEPGLDKDIQAAYDKITGLSAELPKEIVTLEMVKELCPGNHPLGNAQYSSEELEEEPSVEI